MLLSPRKVLVTPIQCQIFRWNFPTFTLSLIMFSCIKTAAGAGSSSECRFYREERIVQFDSKGNERNVDFEEEEGSKKGREGERRLVEKA